MDILELLRVIGGMERVQITTPHENRRSGIVFHRECMENPFCAYVDSWINWIVDQTASDGHMVVEAACHTTYAMVCLICNRRLWK